MVGFRVIGTKSSSLQTASKLLVLTTEHIDNLLSEWYPKIDTYVDLQGVKAIRRVSFCHECINQAVQIKSKSTLDTIIQSDHFCEETGVKVANQGEGEVGPFASAFDVVNELSVDGVNELSVDGVHITLSENGEIINNFEDFNTGEDEVDFLPFDLNEEQLDLMAEHRERGKGKLVVFELEEASKLIRDNKPLLCPFHFKLNPKSIFPDLVSFKAFEEFLSSFKPTSLLCYGIIL